MMVMMRVTVFLMMIVKMMKIKMMILITEGVLMGGAGVQIVETRIFWEVLW